MKPRRAKPAATHTTPETIAIAPASVTARWGSPSERGATTARITAASDESGLRTRIRLGPKSAYASNGTIVAYRPLIPGTPEASAYAIPTGTSIVVMTRPAMRSSRSQDALYSRRTVRPGSQRTSSEPPALKAGPAQADHDVRRPAHDVPDQSGAVVFDHQDHWPLVDAKVEWRDP